MSGPVLLLLGLVALGLAVWLLLRADHSGRVFSEGATARPLPPASDAGEGGADSAGADAGEWAGGDAGGAAGAGARGAAGGAAGDGAAGAPGASVCGPDSGSGPASDAESEYGSSSGSDSGSESGPDREIHEDALVPEAPRRLPVSDATERSGFDFLKRRRRQWAADHGCDFDREDREVAGAWPSSILQLAQPGDGPVVVRDMVSGFFDGHQVHIGDVGESTLLAMRRAGFSPVRVHYSKAGAMPPGMRRTSLLDQAPFFSYSTDVRALDRMLDSRMEDALAALAQVANDVAWENNWVVVGMSRRLEMSVWTAILPHVRAMADAAMVLPPASLNTPLELAHADQTRPMPGGPLVIEVGLRNVDEAVAEGLAHNAEDSAEDPEAAVTDRPVRPRPSHIQAVPDPSRAQAEDPADTPAADTHAEATHDAGDEPAAAHVEPPTPERPDITRPAEPVAFPTRVNARFEGPVEGEGVEMLASEEEIPPIGEDPEHVSAAASSRPQVIRVDLDYEGTIFDDTAGSEAWEDRRRRGGRHRAPEARHARPEPIQAIEYETVDGEIVED